MSISNMTVAISLLCLILGCSLFTEEERIDYIEAVVSVDSIRVEKIVDKGVGFTAFCTVSDPCWEFWKYDKDIIEFDVYIKIYARRDSRLFCPQVIWSIEVPLFVRVGSFGRYHFHFWQTDSSSLDTTIVI